MDKQTSQMALDALLVELGEQVDRVVRCLHTTKDVEMNPTIAFLLGALSTALRLADAERLQDYEDYARKAMLRHEG